MALAGGAAGNKKTKQELWECEEAAWLVAGRNVAPFGAGIFRARRSTALAGGSLEGSMAALESQTGATFVAVSYRGAQEEHRRRPLRLYLCARVWIQNALVCRRHARAQTKGTKVKIKPSLSRILTHYKLFQLLHLFASIYS